MFLLFCVGLSLTVLLYKLLERCRTWRHYTLVLMLYLFFFCTVFLSCVKSPQFTTTAAALSAAAALIPLTLDTERPLSHVVPNLVLFGFLSFLAVCVRQKVYLMILPVTVLILVVRFLLKRRLFKRVLAFVWVAAFVYAGTLGIDLAMTNSDDYRVYAEFNQARSDVQDYYGFPDYEENRGLYDALAVDEYQYRMMIGGYFDVDPVINADTFRMISDYQDEMVQKEPFGSRIADALLETPGWFFKSYLPVPSIILLIFSLATLAFAFVKGERSIFALGTAAIAAVFLEIAWLIFGGRMVLRLIESMVLLFGMLLLNLFVSLFLRYIPDKLPNIAGEAAEGKKNTRALAGIAMRVTAAVTAVMLVVANYYTLETIAENKIKNSEAVFTMNAYCQAHPENFYFYSVSKFGGAIGYVFSDDETVFKNSSAIGGWSVKSPMYYEKLDRYGIQGLTEGLINHRNVYYIDTKYPTALRDYMREKYGEELTLVKVDDIYDKQLFVYKVAQVIKPMEDTPAS